MNVSIIIVNYNTRSLLADCIASVQQNVRNVEYEIIIVDNASTDGSESFIKTEFPEVIWVNAGENIGFGCANNLGVQCATGDYLFLLNSDTILCNDAISIFLEYTQKCKDNKIGVLGSWLLDKNKHDNKSYGDFPSPKNEIRYLLEQLRYKENGLSNRAEKDVDYIIGADMFIRKELFLQFGGFDPNFFMYYEETDFQYRLAQAGYIRRIIPGPKIIHLEGGSFGNSGLTVNRFMMAQRSYNYYLKKHVKGLKYLLYKSVLCLIRLSIFVTTDWTLKEKIKAYSLVLK